MTMQTIPGAGFWCPEIPRLSAHVGAISSMLMDATAEKVAFIGHMWNKDGAGKNVTKIGILPGTVTLNAASRIKISLQSIDQTSGQPARPSGTILGATNNGFVTQLPAAFTTNTWHQSAALGEVVALTQGQEVAVVIEYDTFTAADVFNVRGLTGVFSDNFPCASIFTSAWGQQVVLPNLIFEFDDGSFGTIEGGFPFSALYNTGLFNSGSTPDEYGMEFQVPFPMKVDAFQVVMAGASASANANVILSDLTDGTVVYDGAVMQTLVGRWVQGVFPAALSLSANTIYRLSLQPQSTTSVNLYGFDVANADHFQAHGFGTSGVINTRTDGGAWGTATTTRRPFMSLRACAFDDGAGGGGGSGETFTGSKLNQGFN